MYSVFTNATITPFDDTLLKSDRIFPVTSDKNKYIEYPLHKSFVSVQNSSFKPSLRTTFRIRHIDLTPTFPPFLARCCSLSRTQSSFAEQWDEMFLTAKYSLHLLIVSRLFTKMHILLCLARLSFWASLLRAFQLHVETLRHSAVQLFQHERPGYILRQVIHQLKHQHLNMRLTMYIENIANELFGTIIFVPWIRQIFLPARPLRSTLPHAR